MLVYQTICSVYIILVAEVFLLSRGHPDCNHKKVVDRFFYMCSSYTPYSSTKRETNVAQGASFPPNSPAGILSPVQDQNIAFRSWQQQPQQFPGAPDGQWAPSLDQQQPQPTPNIQAGSSHYPWQIAPNNPSNVAGSSSSPQQQDVHDHRVRRKEMQLPAALPNEPEDFASFNNWYLNPVYADADWQSAIERWRRKSHINDEIWRFVRQKCCVNGCPFPEDFLELDKRVNICGMR